MEGFKKYTPETCVSTRKGELRISFSSKSGGIFFNRTVVEKMKLTEGQKVTLFQSEKDEREWFVAVTSDGFALRTKDEKSLQTQNTAVCKEILRIAKVEAPSTSLLIGVPSVIDGLEMYPIILASAKNKAQ
ncbi:MAG: hypothetical protein PHQ74_15040 [Crocinitomicaceae bacterium]|nr:hypothetical protein [Crocinitomicaceae bacterium]